MKNIHILPTEESTLWFYKGIKDFLLTGLTVNKSTSIDPRHIYITSSEEIKEGVDQWYLDKFLNKPMNSGSAQYGEKQNIIILTTDPTLIADGVQSIDDEFLEWFVKNPSCEFVEVAKQEVILGYYDAKGLKKIYDDSYKIIIPQKEPKQETLEEAAYRLSAEKFEPKHTVFMLGVIEGAKWQAERMYAEADNIMRFLDTEVELKLSDTKTIERIKWYFETYFEQFKKK